LCRLEVKKEDPLGKSRRRGGVLGERKLVPSQLTCREKQIQKLKERLPGGKEPIKNSRKGSEGFGMTSKLNKDSQKGRWLLGDRRGQVSYSGGLLGADRR